MSLYGRRIIDRIKHAFSHRLTLPVPPYHTPAYWEKVYSQLDENDVFEWGDINLESQLKSFSYNINQEHTNEIRKVYGENIANRSTLQQEGQMDFHNVLFQDNHVTLGQNNHTKNDEIERSTILILGCGNSRLGEDILHYYIDMGPYSIDKMDNALPPRLVQCDISTHVVNSMTKRYHKYVEKDLMSIVQDDATQFTLINDESVDSVVDKGLVDALFCAEQGGMVQQVMGNVHRTLKAGKVFMFFSFSRPEYLLQHTAQRSDGKVEDVGKNDVLWSDVDILELNEIFIYRFVKAGSDTSRRRHKKKKHKRRISR